ncbi:hypothetical protein BHM03_00048569 [Ensete ventricosum]|nr:hypothetical protein BHM03_00048569 [Ensete ventricosum]
MRPQVRVSTLPVSCQPYDRWGPHTGIRPASRVGSTTSTGQLSDAHRRGDQVTILILKGERQAKEEEETGARTAPASAGAVEAAEAVARGAAALPCPRCKSRETKFCYFNNYNVNQPRHFCKACHRYWTAGGALRNVPVGAGRRRGRPAHRGGGGVVPATCVLDYPSPGYLGGAAAERWLLRPEAPAGADRGLDGGLR